LSNKDDDELAVVVVVAKLPVAEITIENFILSLVAEQINGRIFSVCFIGQN
jgi:hypothetical protein